MAFLNRLTQRLTEDSTSWGSLILLTLGLAVLVAIMTVYSHP